MDYDKVYVFDIKFPDNKEIAPITIELEDDDNEFVDDSIKDYFQKNFGSVPTFNWEWATEEPDPAEDLENIRAVLRKYFEGNKEYDPNFSAQDAIDEISAIVGF